MARHSRSFIRTRDPYCLLALSVFFEAFRTIECYYSNKGTDEEISEGKRAVRWIKRMEGNYRELAMASGWELDKFHQKCIKRVNEIKREIYQENERRRVEENIDPSPEG